VPARQTAHLQACAGALPRVEATRPGAAGKAVLFATEDVIVGELDGVRDVPHPGERIAAGHPVCTVVASATTPEEVYAALQAQAARVRAQLRVEVPADG